jgi:hypothetical protein
MAKYEALYMIDLALDARDEQEARSLLNTVAWPSGVRPAGPADVRLRRINTPDKRLLSHLPDLPKDRLLAALKKLSPSRLFIVALCASEPRYMHSIIETTLRNTEPNSCTRESLVLDITALKYESWLVPVSHNIELSEFPSMNVQAAFSALAQGH